MALAETAAAGVRVDTLRTLRDHLARQLDVCESARDVAALSQRLMDVLEQIDAAEKAQPTRKGTGLDEFTRRREERAAPGPDGPAERQQRSR